MIDADKMLHSVARNCGRLRKAQQLTYDALARQSGISKGMVVEIERGKTNPSIATLCRLANAFGVDLGELLTPAAPKARIVVHPAAAGRILWETRAGSRAALLDTVRVGALAAEIWAWRLAPREFFDGDAHLAGTIEFLAVQRGILRLETAGDVTDAPAGTTARLCADAPHRYANRGRAACEFRMTVLEPVA